MKPILAALFLLAAISPAASGRLFDNPQEFVQRLDGGAVQGESPGNFPFETVKQGSIGRIQVEASFFKGRCLHILYRAPLSETVVAQILEKNGGDSTWTKKDDKNWARADGAAFAYLQDGLLWITSTELAPDWQALQEGRYQEALVKSALERL